ncbi:hypothetical protein OG775_15845 [Streptomyces platensis]|uniref:hypothetical protein n=1 Tax=Streptomyces platensis TaxID=58346 RepID=UPI002255E809|nr:hypothetical protein [Streptomyces platensis]MCX4636583.1 hypothetical protein [Streptomyces platensis]
MAHRAGERWKWVDGVRVARRPVALAAAVVLILEAFGIVLLNWILSIVVDRQQMSLAGLQPRAMSTGSWVGGILFGLYLLFCAVVLLRCALRDRAPGGFTRIALISCAVVHGMLGAFAVGLVGWVAFLAMMVVLALLVLTLMAYGEGASGDAHGNAENTPNGAPPVAPTSA